MSTHNKFVNYLYDSSFQTVITGFENIDLNVQSINIPGLTNSSINMPNGLVHVKTRGNNIVYDPLTLNFLVDENLENYFSIYEWFLKIGYPEKQSQFASLATGDKRRYDDRRDISVIILNNKSNPIKIFKFVEAFPTDIGSLDFNTIQPKPGPMSVNVSFAYSYFAVESA